MGICGGFGNRKQILSTVRRFNPKIPGQWETLPSMSVERANASICSLFGRLYVCGGKTVSNQTISLAECFNPDAALWETIQSMATPRAFAAANVTINHFYICGGLDDQECKLKTAERY